jgi:hypothetical protein
MTTTITVTADDIAKGKPCSAGRCPIATALNRSLSDEYSNTLVGHHFASVLGKRGRWVQIKLPDNASRFVRAFDEGQPVEPFSFAVEI